MPRVIRKYRRPYIRLIDFFKWCNADNLSKYKFELFLKKLKLGSSKSILYLERMRGETNRLFSFDIISENLANKILYVSYDKVNHYRLKDNESLTDLVVLKEQLPASKKRQYIAKHYLHSEIRKKLLSGARSSKIWKDVFCVSSLSNYHPDIISERDSYKIEYCMLCKFGIGKYSMKKLELMGYNVESRGSIEWKKGIQ